MKDIFVIEVFIIANNPPTFQSDPQLVFKYVNIYKKKEARSIDLASFRWCHPGSNPELHKSAICKAIRGLTKNHEIIDFCFSEPGIPGFSVSIIPCSRKYLY